jgi:hypothetical protein
MKGHEGGILARLLATPGLQLIGSRMYQPSEAFVDEYIQVHKETFQPKPFVPFLEFLDTNLRHDAAMRRGMPNHLMFLLFSGKNARSKLTEVIGDHLPDPRVGMIGRTIRGAYGDYEKQPNGHITNFQPAIVGAAGWDANLKYLEIFAKYATSDGGIVDDWYTHLDRVSQISAF